jgi:hypothetical protein
MQLVIYKNQITEGYELLHKGYMYPIPMNITIEKAHKILERMERNERIWNWIFNNDGKLGIILAAVIFIGIVILAS